MDMIKINNAWIRLKQWSRKNRKTLIIVGFILLTITVGATTYLILSRSTSSTPVVKKKLVKPKPVVKYYSPLTGDLVESKAITEQATTAIMIENSPDARPQSGLKDGGVVFEAIAEGGITRFLAIYQEKKPQLIGPVRSLRMYYVDWLAPFNASVAHVGGSAAALAEIRNGSYRDIDQFFNSDSYWRATDRYAPHNVYTSFERLDALNQSKSYLTSSFTGFSRIDGKPVKVPDASGVNINISGPLYNSSYIYNKETNAYARSLAGEPHIDRESGAQIAPSVVIALKVNEVTVFEDGYRQSIETIGSGEAVIFQNGTVVNATWQKASRLGQITFTDATGKDIPLVRGQTWISAVPNGTGSVTWN